MNWGSIALVPVIVVALVWVGLWVWSRGRL